MAFTDPEFGATTARQALDNGADVVFGAGGQTGNGALIEVATTEGQLCIGVDTDQWETVPEAQPCLVTSAMKMISPASSSSSTPPSTAASRPAISSARSGCADFHDLADHVPDDVKTQIDELTEQVLSGEVPTGYSRKTTSITQRHDGVGEPPHPVAPNH